MFRSGCITIIVLIALGFAFEQYSHSRFALELTRGLAWVARQQECLSTFHCGCTPEEYAKNHPHVPEKFVVSRLVVSGSNDVTTLKRDLSVFAMIEALDSNGCYLDENANVQILVRANEEEAGAYLNFAKQAIYYHGFKIVKIKQTVEYR